ncbi:hypothetical protein G9A89_012730 [Geosiphon pyriformis]|nr:hypothetical protein G9A89_012730 [Geosiphon pyriformis]
MPECMHNTDAEFDLRYLEKDVIKLKPYSHTCIDLKVALEIPATTMRTSTNNNYLKVAEPENIGANHLGFTKFLFQQYSQQLGLNNNHFPAESAFNFYVNNKITDCLGRTVSIESARENFYTELFQHTSLPRNYSFASIIREINQTIEKYTQQQFPITYTDKGKRRLQTLVVTPKQIQPPTWMKTRVESPTNLSYHYTPGITKLEEKEENQKFTYQNLIPKNLEVKTPNVQTSQNPNLEHPEIRTPNIQILPNQNNQNPDLINQQYILPKIVINQLVELIGQLLQQPAYAPITKLKKFTSKENNAQAWINNIAKTIIINNWDDTKALQAISYFL